MSKRKSHKLLLSSGFLLLSALIFAETYLPFRATTDEMHVVPDINIILGKGVMTQARYFSGVLYQFQTSVALKLSGLSSTSLQLISPFIAGIVFFVFFTIGFLIYRSEVDGLWWGFIPIMLSLLVFPGFVMRMWESTHKAFTFTFLFLTLFLFYLVNYRESDTDHRYLFLVGIFLAAVLMLNYLWGFVYSGLAGLVALSQRKQRFKASAVAALSGFLAIVTPAFSPLHRYHGAYFNTFKSQLDRVTSIGRHNSKKSAGKQTPNRGSAPADDVSTTGGTNTAESGTSSFPDIGPGSSQLNQKASGPQGIFEQIDMWDPVEIAGFAFPSWYLYSMGIGIVAIATIISGLLCLYLAFRRRLRNLGRITLLIILFHGVIGIVFLGTGDIATFKRIIIIPGFFGVLSLVVFVVRDEIGIPRSRKWTHFAIILFTVVLLIAAGLATNRLPTGGDKPIDAYVDQPESNQAEWILTYGQNSTCFAVRKMTVSQYHLKNTHIARGGHIGYLDINPWFEHSVYQSKQNHETVYLCDLE